MSRTPRVLQRASGRLSLDEIGEGIDRAIENARGLLQDSEVMRNHGRSSRALSCVFAAEQEAGKVKVLRNMAQIDPSRPDQWKEQWEAFYIHDKKGMQGLIESFSSDLAQAVVSALSGRTWQGLAYVGQAFQIGAAAAEDLRRLCLYTDFDPGFRRWVGPKDVPQQVIEDRFPVADAAVTRLETLQQLGFFRVEVLSVMHEVYAPITRELPLRHAMTLDELEKVSPVLRQAAKTFFHLVVERGLIDPDA